MEMPALPPTQIVLSREGMGSFRILSDGTSNLRIEAPPLYWAAVFFLVVALLSLLVLTGTLLSRRGTEPRTATLNGVKMRSSDIGKGWKTPTITFALFLITGYAAFALLQTSSLTLDRNQGEFVVDKGYGLMGHVRFSGPITSIAYATLETDSSAQRFVLVLNDGQRVSLASFTDQSNQSEAASAINQFMHVGDRSHE